MDERLVLNLDEEMSNVKNDYNLNYPELNYLSLNLDKELKKYLFRGWYMTNIMEDKMGDSCPCCGSEIKKS